MSERSHDYDPLQERTPPRFVVGIDLGTTNSAATYIDTEEEPWQIRVFKIPQLVAAGQIESRETLPSFHYEPAAGEWDAASREMTAGDAMWRHTVGVLARDQGVKTPGRLIASAKSWLCHAGVDRTADVLPWHGAADVERLSPIEVSARFLRHIRRAWDAQFRDHPLADQDIVLTLPASFDEVARELTVEAAARAELPRVVLIEEPQAAFYAWVYKHADNWGEHVRPGHTILVCDIGGGTSDFTLIRARLPHGSPAVAPAPTAADESPQPSASTGEDSSSEGDREQIQFHRVAVGDHLILGGDNLDLALAQHVEGQLPGDGKLGPQQWDVLVRSCRQAKETLLGDDPPDHYSIHLPGGGARVIGGGLQVRISRDDVIARLVDGFLPRCELDDKPAQRTSGFQEFGLPYAADAAMTRYLAAFLTSHREVCVDPDGPPPDHDPARPDVVLFNGGFFASPLLRERFLDVLQGWFRGSDSSWSPKLLDNDRLDLAVARGAAYYGMVRRGQGVRIAASLARSYYIGVEADQLTALCVVPGNAEPGHTIDLERPLELLVSRPVEFPLFVSSIRLTDNPGDLVAIDREQMTPLPPIRTVLRTRRRGDDGTATVVLHARLTEIGTIDLWCSETGTSRSWKLQFDIRSAIHTDIQGHTGKGEAEGVVDEETWLDCHASIASVFSEEGNGRPATLVRRVADVTGCGRNEWPTPLLRRIWEALMEFEGGRRKSPAHEARWLNLLGYALRPGYGLALDDWRVAQTWRVVQGKLIHSAGSGRAESQILWRRIAGGLSAGQQLAIAERLLGPVRVLHRKLTTGLSRARDVAINPNESSEVWRLLGSLELLGPKLKVELGNMLVDLLPKRKMADVTSAMVWAIARLGERVPVYGPLNTVVPAERAADWLETIVSLDGHEAIHQLAAMQLARRTGDRYRDLDEAVRRKAARWLTAHDAAPHLVQLVTEGGALDTEEQGQVVGESLPSGLRIT